MSGVISAHANDFAGTRGSEKANLFERNRRFFSAEFPEDISFDAADFSFVNPSVFWGFVSELIAYQTHEKPPVSLFRAEPRRRAAVYDESLPGHK